MAQDTLSVVIVGAGIAGLAAAVALRPFANVQIIEAAHELKPFGAAVTLGPGVVRIMRTWGIHLEEWDGVGCREFRLYNSEGDVLNTMPYRARELVGEDVMIIHRADLHSALLSAATDEDGPGKPAILQLGQRVSHIDTNGTTISLEDGTTLHADLIVGADGVRSITRPFVTGSSKSPMPAGESAYRLLVSAEDLRRKGHPLVAATGLFLPDMLIATSEGRKIVAYPCRGGRYLNVVAFIPDVQLHEETSQRWTGKGDLGALLQSFSHFGSYWTDIFSCGQQVGMWQMRDMDPLSKWVNNRTILIGDAAHPMLPHMAGGAMSAIEDAESLAAVLQHEPESNINSALERAFRIRFKRASFFQLSSRVGGIKRRKPLSHEENVKNWNYSGAIEWEASDSKMVLRPGETASYELED